MVTQKYKHEILLNFSRTLVKYPGKIQFVSCLSMYSKSSLGQSKNSQLISESKLSLILLPAGSRQVCGCVCRQSPADLPTVVGKRPCGLDTTQTAQPISFTASLKCPLKKNSCLLTTAHSLPSLHCHFSPVLFSVAQVGRLRVDQQVHWPRRCLTREWDASLAGTFNPRVVNLLDSLSLAWCCGDHSTPDDPDHSPPLPLPCLLVIF